MKRALLLFSALLLHGCGSGTDPVEYNVDKTGYNVAESDHTSAYDASEALIGSWTHSTYISPQEAARISSEPIPPGVEIDMTVAGTTVYHVGNRYDADAEITLNIRANGETIPLKMLRRETGTWKVHGDVLVETVTGGTATALDDQTKAVLREAPEAAAFAEPIAGETSSSDIQSVTPSAIDLREQESQINLTLRRNG